MTAYELKSIEMFNVKGVDFRCILWVISRDEAINRLDNSVLDDKKMPYQWSVMQIKHLLK